MDCIDLVSDEEDTGLYFDLSSEGTWNQNQKIIKIFSCSEPTSESNLVVEEVVEEFDCDEFTLDAGMDIYVGSNFNSSRQIIQDDSFDSESDVQNNTNVMPVVVAEDIGSDYIEPPIIEEDEITFDKQ